MKSLFSRDESKQSPQLRRQNAKDCWPGVRKVLAAQPDSQPKETTPDPRTVPEAPPRDQKKDPNAGLQVDQRTDPSVGNSMHQ